VERIFCRRNAARANLDAHFRRAIANFGKPTERWLATIVRCYKAEVTKRVRLLNGEPLEWQRGFYERVLSNGREYGNVERYIVENPRRWLLKERDG
jgi:hypothetical protein